MFVSNVESKNKTGPQCNDELTYSSDWFAYLKNYCSVCNVRVQGASVNADVNEAEEILEK